MLNSISSFSIIILIIGTLTYGLAKKVDIYVTFVTGAKKGLKTTADIFPYLLAFIISINLFKESGLSDFIISALSPFFDFIHFKSELLPLMIFRPISGSASSAVLLDLFKVYTPDSFIGLCASVMMGSTETTLYVLNVYLSALKIKNIRYALKVCLICDILGFIIAYLLSCIFFL